MPQQATQQNKQTHRPLLVVALALLLGLSSPFVSAEKLTVSDMLQLYLQDEPHPEVQWGILNAFYQPREFLPVWVDGSGPLPRAELLRRTLNDARLEGLDSAAYPIADIEQNWRAKDPATLARLELLLSSAALDYGHDVQVGRYPPDAINPLWHIPVAEFNGLATLEELAHSEDMAASLAALPPPHPEYQRLRSALAYYRQLARLGGWSGIPDGPYLKVGKIHPQVPLLRQRLFIEGDLLLDVANEDPNFDELLKVAVERFQVRHGLKIDGVVGPATRAAMNVSVDLRIEQIKLNMERWRWLPRELGERYIMVNTGGFHLNVHEGDKQVLTMEVIAGRRDRPTPIITGRLHSLVFNPDWTPTPTIIIEDLIPKQLRNSDYMTSHKIHVYRNGEELDPRTVDWRRVNQNYLPYELRQDPGPLNPMGRVKFLFSNRFDVYMHDTPQTGLFDEYERTFSSGCIRVSQAEKLATYVLARSGNGWDAAAVRQAMNSSQQQTVVPDQSMPVYLVYFTSWVGSDNRAQFRDDVYQLDSTTQARPGKPRTSS